MPYLDKIVNSINQGIINDSLSIMAPSKIFACGITETILDVREDGNDQTVNVRYPALVNDDGEGTMIAIDDSYHVIFYHRVESIVNSTITKNGYGDNAGGQLETANLSLIFFAFRDKIRKPAWWFESAIKDQVKEAMNLTSTDGSLKLQRSIIRIGNSNFDKLSLLQREFSEIELNYPNLVAFELKYRIESTWKKGCFLTCNC